MFFRPLGSLNYLRVWHDNTGWENYASWFVTAIVIRDVQTEEKFEFIINNWLAVDKGDGEVKFLLNLNINFGGQSSSIKMRRPIWPFLRAPKQT